MLTIHRQKRRIPLGFNILASKRDPDMVNRMFWSIEPIADQIVVVVDQTAEPSFYQIARQYTDDVFLYPWPDDFALARNRALKRTQTDYVAWIDTDEWYHPMVAARIQDLMRSPMGKAYYIWQVSPSTDGKIIYVPQIRIFPNRPGLKWEISIHEQVLPSLQRIGVKTELTDLRVEHLGYLNDRDVERKNRRNLRLLRREVRRNPHDAFSRQNYRIALAFERRERR